MNYITSQVQCFAIQIHTHKRTRVLKLFVTVLRNEKKTKQHLDVPQYNINFHITLLCSNNIFCLSFMKFLEREKMQSMLDCFQNATHKMTGPQRTVTVWWRGVVRRRDLWKRQTAPFQERTDYMSNESFHSLCAFLLLQMFSFQVWSEIFYFSVYTL